VRAGSLDELVPAVRVGGTIAALGVLLSLLAGVSRTAFAMAADGELPGWLGAVHRTRTVPHHAEVAVGAGVALLVALTDLRHAIGFSSFCVLAYYAIANASAWTLPPERRLWSRSLSAVGLVGCAALAGSLPADTVFTGAAVLTVGALARAMGRSMVIRGAVRRPRRRYPTEVGET
jgi:APA family basic amino acid/polyamine antiporter